MCPASGAASSCPRAGMGIRRSGRHHWSALEAQNRAPPYSPDFKPIELAFAKLKPFRSRLGACAVSGPVTASDQARTPAAPGEGDRRERKLSLTDELRL